jgi:hypothetical protein
MSFNPRINVPQVHTDIPSPHTEVPQVLTQMASSENDGAICGALEGVTGLQSSKICFFKNQGSRTKGPSLGQSDAVAGIKINFALAVTARCDSSITYLPLAC